MPPVNSPSDTRPSTPPPYTFPPSSDALSSSPYLQQLEEAISTPVPDLASTLNLSTDATPETRALQTSTAIPARIGDAWSTLPVLDLTRNHDTAELAQDHDPDPEQDQGPVLERSNSNSLARRPYLTEAEFRNWSSESRTRLLMQGHNQSLRSWLREENGGRSDSNRSSYSTRGGGPVRQRLYDWAMSRNRSRDLGRNETGEDEESANADNDNDTDNNTRRELERALRNYRVARNVLRSGRNSASDLGAVPTASALRAYWNEDSNDPGPNNNSSETNGRMSAFALSDFVEQHRLERQQRRHIELARARAESRPSQVEPSRSASTLREGRSSEAFMRVRNTIRYLSDLRYTSVQGGLELARNLGLDSLYEAHDLNTPSDLPMTIENLPTPTPSSWLTPGMVWHGLQSTDRETAPPPPLASTLRLQRQREYLRRAMVRRGLADSASAETSSPGLQTVDSASMLLDADRYVSDLLQDNTARWGFGQYASQSPYESMPSSSARLSQRPPVNVPATIANNADHWPVVVTIHSVSLDSMTVTGTMAASQIPDKIHPSGPSSNTNITSLGVGAEGKSMESFFQGEIIDFRSHVLESEGRTFGYRVGGLDVDARYWARLGPFRREIEREVTKRRVASGDRWKTKAGGRLGVGKDEDEIGAEESVGEKEARENEADEVMARCLGSSKWIEEKLGCEWILMRWKEKCFVTPASSPISSSEDAATAASYVSSSIHPSSTPTSRIYTTTTTTTYDQGSGQHHPTPTSTSWGLTISGFYYVALNRLTGEIEGLYYDPGSQPYQALRMVPLGTSLGDEMKEKENDGGGGVRKWFPAVEFR